ncbi:PREDICTED: uncharacterized protein LOC106149287 [Chinchilla lanigera]|uniref:uncharacterized protein LOC106149287 n=1 Tax=Chinchilla lanigera TaxID=34839 RepID=UPI0006980F8F|nr:PREDICTED: uncharacterized protein LOC106149287 [Chinchilla lanigera]
MRLSRASCASLSLRRTNICPGCHGYLKKRQAPFCPSRPGGSRLFPCLHQQNLLLPLPTGCCTQAAHTRGKRSTTGLPASPRSCTDAASRGNTGRRLKGSEGGKASPAAAADTERAGRATAARRPPARPPQGSSCSVTSDSSTPAQAASCFLGLSCEPPPGQTPPTSRAVGPRLSKPGQRVQPEGWRHKVSHQQFSICLRETPIRRYSIAACGSRATGNGSDRPRALVRSRPLLRLGSQRDSVTALRSLSAGNSHQLQGQKRERCHVCGPAAWRRRLASHARLRRGAVAGSAGPGEVGLPLPASSARCARPAWLQLTSRGSSQPPQGRGHFVPGGPLLDQEGRPLRLLCASRSAFLTTCFLGAPGMDKSASCCFFP